MSGSMKGKPGDFPAFVEDTPSGRIQIAADQVEEGCFPSPVWTNDGMDGIGPDLDIYVIHGDQSAKFLPQFPGDKNKVICFWFQFDLPALPAPFQKTFK
jgi:hypothetical protein